MKPELFRYGIKQRKCKFDTKIWDWTPDKHYNILKDQIEWIDQTSESETESTYNPLFDKIQSLLLDLCTLSLIQNYHPIV
jgi:hypothetical protein